jgi:hypothetical protein
VGGNPGEELKPVKKWDLSQAQFKNYYAMECAVKEMF